MWGTIDMEVRNGSFAWDSRKERVNLHKHHVGFLTACEVFKDPRRIVLDDAKHSAQERRYFCIGRVRGRVLTVRFLYLGEDIRIIGAAEWRKWRKFYEKETR